MRRLGIAMQFLEVGTDVMPHDVNAFRAAFGLGRTGAALIRPDGVIAARFADIAAWPSKVLAQALGSVSSATHGKPVG
jgi:hypothetical protein